MFRSSTLQKTNMVRPPMPNTYLLNYDYPEKSIGQSEVTLVAALVILATSLTLQLRIIMD